MSRTRTLSSRKLSVVVAIAALGLALAACTPDVPQPVVTVSQNPITPGDGTLRIGTAFASTGAQSYLGPAEAAAVTLAARDINAAGGVLGKPVEVVNSDSGDVSTDTLEKSLAGMLTKPIDALIGPSSSVLAERVLPLVVAARIPMISPAATSVRLTGLPDSGFLFRTVGSAALQGTALGAAIGQPAAKVAVVYLGDETGAAIEATLASSLSASGRSLVLDQKYASTTSDFAPVIDAVKKAAPDAVVFMSNFGTMEQNKAMITQLTAAGFGGAKLWLTSDNLADYSQALPPGTMSNVSGSLDGAIPDVAFTARIAAVDPTISNFRYAAESYDAAILVALAATVGHNDAGAAIAGRLQDVSVGGIKCTDFAECLAVLKTQPDIDYDGVSGPVSFDGAGDPRIAHFGLMRYDAGNRFAAVGSLVGG